jgi:hypothetical protein
MMDEDCQTSVTATKLVSLVGLPLPLLRQHSAHTAAPFRQPIHPHPCCRLAATLQTTKSLTTSLFAPTNARDLVIRHHYKTMDRL